MLKKTVCKMPGFMLGLTFLLAGLCFQNQTLGQEAIVTKNLEIQIDESLELKGHYDINADEFYFESQQEAADFFMELNPDYVAFRPMLDDGIVKMYLQLKKKPDWTVSQWNNYLAGLLSFEADKNTSVND